MSHFRTAVGTCFAHTSLDYVAVINTAHARKAHIVLEPVRSLLRSSSVIATASK